MDTFRCSAKAIHFAAFLALLSVLISDSQGAATAASEAADTERIQVTADRLEYEGDGRTLIAVGNVTVSQGTSKLQADFVRIDTVTQDVLAKGDVVLIRDPAMVWRGDELEFNWKTGLKSVEGFHLQAGFFHVYADDAESLAPNHLRIRHPVVTPCEPDAREEFQLRAQRAEIRDRRYATLHHAVLWVGPIPLFYTPYLWRDLESPGRLDSLPGFSSRLGAFLLTSYHTPLNARGTVKTASHVNLYSKRGAGVGQDLTWEDREVGTQGGLRAFYIQDQQLYRDEAERVEREEQLTDRGRYRLRLQHRADLTVRDRLWIDTSYLSDPWVEKDFFRRDYRASPEPDNRAVLTHRGELFVASLLLQPRWNDFYEAVTRLPEARFDNTLRELGESGLFYESRSSAGWYERLYPAGENRADYDAFRVDTRHVVFYPTRSFSFLNFTPRAAYRATYYSATLGEEDVRNRWTVRKEEDGTQTPVLVEERFRPEEGADIRHVFEAGWESSFKAFKVLDEGSSVWGDGLRHVAEPYVRHTLIPRPNIRPGNLYDFDSVDRIDRTHTVSFGLRNKLQTRRAPGLRQVRPASDEDGMSGSEPSVETPTPRGIADLVDADLYTSVRLSREEGEETMGPLGWDLRLRPLSGYYLDFDGRYDWDGQTVMTANTRLGMVFREAHTVSLEHRFREDQRNHLGLHSTWFFQSPWSFRTYHRVDLGEGRIEEQSYLVRRRMRCISLGVGFRHEPGVASGQSDHYRLWVDFQLLAMPSSAFQLGD